MNEPPQFYSQLRFRLRKYALIAALAWTAFIAASLGWSRFAQRRKMLDYARHEAQISFQKELLLRFWVDGHSRAGPVTNPRAEARGLGNPESMLRQILEQSPTHAGYLSRLASLKPTRPEAVPDAWEARALQAFAKGEPEVTSVATIAGQDYMRVMRPLVNEASCVTCHDAQDYKIGDIRGGMSVSVPLAPLKAYGRMESVALATVDGVIWVLGLGVIVFGARRLQAYNVERARGETVLRASEEHYRSLFDNMLNGYAHCRMIFVDGRPQDFIYLRVNGAFGILTGLKDVVGRSASAVIPGLRESDAELLEAYGRVALSGVPERFERFVKALDTWFLLSVYSPAKDHFVVVFDVITERKRAEQALRQSEERYRALFEHNPLSLWLYDLESLRFLAVNESAVQHYGYTREEFLAMTIKDIRPAEDIPVMIKAVAKGRAEALSTGEWRHRRKDGTIIRVEVFSRPLAFDGRAARLVLAADITEKKLLEEKFLHAQRLESIGMLAAGIAHDLNNMLAPIMFAAPMLRRSLSDPRDLKVLATLEQSAERGAGLVRQILGFVHSTAGEFRPTQVKHLVQDVIGLIEQTFPKSIQLDCQISSDLWLVQGNATQIHQVLLNLCVNARDAMPQGGTLRLGADNRRLDEATAATIPGARPGAWLVLEVSDTGTGIPSGILERIWDPFFTTKGVGQGTGLGLATVRGIAASHHGFVELHTEVGRGTTFRVFLPAVESEASLPSSALPFDIPDGHGELILVADDDAPVRDIVTDILGQHGYRVVNGSNGMEAMTLMKAHFSEIALVVADIDMPLLGGVALARALLQLRPDIRLLAMSGSSRSELDGSEVRAVQELAHAFLLKPFKPEGLLGTVHRLLHPPGKP